jgi:hypothetical protein
LDDLKLLAVVDAFVEDAISKIQFPESIPGPRGLRGKDGNDFNIEDHEELISKFIQDNLPTEITISDEQLEYLKGADGVDGKDGKNFDVFENVELIKSAIENTVSEIKESLKLKFDDLSEENKIELRGPRGQRGKSGKDFILEEVIPTIHEGIKSHIVGHYHELKLKFDDLKFEDLEALKFRYNHFTPENLLELKGPRGQRGKQGVQGERGEIGAQGEAGKIGPRGAIGPVGLKGPQGFPGKDAVGLDGRNGKDAPVVEEIKLLEDKNSISLKFEMSDGTSINTNEVELPKRVVQNYYSSGGFSSSSGNGTGFVSQAEWLVIEKTAGETISALALVRFLDLNTVVNSTNNEDYFHAKVVGIALNGATTGGTVRILIFGIIEDPFFTYPANTLLFLGANGAITDIPPTTGFSSIIGESPAVGLISLSIREPKVL